MTDDSQVLTTRKLLRYTALLNDQTLVDEALAFTRQLGADPALVASIEYVPAQKPRLARVYITSYLSSEDGGRYVDPDTESYAVEITEVVWREPLPHWWDAVCAQSDEPLA